MQGALAIQPSPANPASAYRVLASLAVLAVGLAITVPIYGGWLSGDANRTFRLCLALLWGGLALATSRIQRAKPFTAVFLGLLRVSLGLTRAWLVGSRPIRTFGLSVETPKGAAVDKVLAEVIPLSSPVLLSALLARRSLASLGLRGGRPGRGLGLGVVASLPLLALFAFDLSGGRDTVAATPPAFLRSWLPWIVLFSVANGFSEELWFRGPWLGALKEGIGAPAAMHVTSRIFCLLHVIVYWGDPLSLAVLTPAWLFVGYAFAWIMRKIGSLWAPVLAHVVADGIFVHVAFSLARM